MPAVRRAITTRFTRQAEKLHRLARLAAATEYIEQEPDGQTFMMDVLTICRYSILCHVRVSISVSCWKWNAGDGSRDTFAPLMGQHFYLHLPIMNSVLESLHFLEILPRLQWITPLSCSLEMTDTAKVHLDLKESGTAGGSRPLLELSPSRHFSACCSSFPHGQTIQFPTYQSLLQAMI